MAEHLYDIRRHMNSDANIYGNCTGCANGHAGRPYPTPGWKCVKCGDTNDVIKKLAPPRIAVPVWK